MDLSDHPELLAMLELNIIKDENIDRLEFQLGNEIQPITLTEEQKGKVAVVKPFLEKFEDGKTSQHIQKDRKELALEKSNSDIWASHNKCHKVTSKTYKEFEKNFNNEATQQMIRETNTRNNYPRCELCSQLTEDECHCHEYDCYKCHAEIFCRSCHMQTTFTPEIFQYQYYYMHIKE